METVEINPRRIEHLLTLFGMSKVDLLNRLNVDRKNGLQKEDVFGERIRLSYLRLIDKLFQKGIGYYFDPKDPGRSKNESIFFRKENFNADLNLGARQIVNRFEEEKLELSTLGKLLDFSFERRLPRFQLDDSPKDSAARLRQHFGIPPAKNKREFLKALIESLAKYNVFVFEFIETHNKKEKANIDGFFLKPNVIVLKRNQLAMKREIFTLLHELGHYLLDEEEIDDVWNQNMGWNHSGSVERWCSDFAFYFLIDGFDTYFSSLPFAEPANDFNHEPIKKIAHNTLLSTLALYTRLRIEERIHFQDYETIKEEILAAIDERRRLEREKAQLEKEMAAAMGIKQRGSIPKPIWSPLYIDTLTTALNSGLINEYQFCTKLKISPDKLGRYFQ